MGVELLAFSFAVFSGLVKFLIAGGEDGFVAASKFVGRGDVADGGVQAHGVVVGNKVGHQTAGVVEAKRGAGTQAVAFERAVPAFDFAVALGIIGSGAHGGLSRPRG